MTTWRLVRDALLVAAAGYLLVGAVHLTLPYFAPPTGWDVVYPNRIANLLLYLMGFGLLAVVWLGRRQPPRSALDSAETR